MKKAKVTQINKQITRRAFQYVYSRREQGEKEEQGGGGGGGLLLLLLLLLLQPFY